MDRVLLERDTDLVVAAGEDGIAPRLDGDVRACTALAQRGGDGQEYGDGQKHGEQYQPHRRLPCTHARETSQSRRCGAKASLQARRQCGRAVRRATCAIMMRGMKKGMLRPVMHLPRTEQ